LNNITIYICYCEK